MLVHFTWSVGVNTFLANAISPLYRVTFVQSIANKSVINRGLVNTAHYVMQFRYCTSFLQWRVGKKERGGGLGRKKEVKVSAVSGLCLFTWACCRPECSEPGLVTQLSWAQQSCSRGQHLHRAGNRIAIKLRSIYRIPGSVPARRES